MDVDGGAFPGFIGEQPTTDTICDSSEETTECGVGAPVEKSQRKHWTQKRLEEEVHKELYAAALQEYLKECYELHGRLVTENKGGALSDQELADKLDEAIASASKRAAEGSTEGTKILIKNWKVMDDTLQNIRTHKH